MAVAMSFLYKDRSYYYESNGITPFRIGGSNADLTVFGLSETIYVSFSQNGKIIFKKGISGEIAIPKDTFVTLDNEKEIAVYITELANNRCEVNLPKSCECHVGRNEKRPGGDSVNEISVGLPFVSSAHFRIIRENGATTVVDDKSKNGIFLNGKRVSKAKMQDGDTLGVFTMQMTLKGDKLIFKNVGSTFKAKKIAGESKRKTAPKNPVKSNDFLFSRSPRMITSIENQDINLEKPPHTNATPQLNWISILMMPAISVVLMLVMVIVMGMHPAMLIMSGSMSVISAVMAVINYKKQKKQHANTAMTVDSKYREYLRGVSARIDGNKKKQIEELSGANPSPETCLSYAENKNRRLWERNTSDMDFLSVRIGTGIIPSALTASYKQPEVVISESELDVEAKKLAEKSRFIDKAPILCDLAKKKLIGITGNRSDEEQLIRNMIVEIAASHAYNEVKIVVLASEDDIGLWSWTRWLPHSSNDQMTERYIFTSVEDAFDELDSINEILSRRISNANDYSKNEPVENVPHYVFVSLCRQTIEKHPIKKHIFNSDDNGCSCLFVYDSISYLPKECNDIIEVNKGQGEIYNKYNSSQRTRFALDKMSAKDADRFARALAPLRLSLDGQAASIPESVTFLEGYGVTKPEQLNIASRWEKAQPYKSLAAPIAAMAGGEPFSFDIHEKRHGVNGIVAGMPGSGKTEMVQTWLLSLAVNFSPKDVSFVLIDFKGTGMIAPFRTIPHLAGSISNLDSNIDRNLIAIQSEVHRREALIDKYSDKSIKNINDLNKAYEKGLVPEKLPILLVVIDEYAEFKKIFPDFGAEIDSLTSKGRALGIFVVLMTQKPAGVVSAKSEDNIKFRWCLRVANYSASREMLGRADAAKITVPGRAYVKVGEDDVYEQVQSYWSGAPYMPNKAKNESSDSLISFVKLDGKKVPCEKKAEQPTEASNEAQIDAVVRYITEFCEQNKIAPAEKIWTEKLPETVYLSNLQKNHFTPENGWPGACVTAPAIGLLDDPEKQMQYPLVLDFAKLGHVLVYGAPVSGKTTLLQTLIMSIAMSCSPGIANIYAMDFGGWNLNVLKDLPHIGGIANDNEPEKIKKLAILLADILETRKTDFSAVGVGNISSYREATGKAVPDIILIVDNIGSAIKLYPELDPFFNTITGSGANYGIYLVATAVATNAVPIRISQNVKYSIALQMTDKSEYTYTVGKVSSDLPPIAGRGYAKGKPPLMFQTALPASGSNEKEIATSIKKTASEMNARWAGEKPLTIPVMPEVIPFGSISTKDVCLGLSVEKVLPIEIDFSSQHFLMISGMPGSGKTSLLSAVAKQIKNTAGGILYSFDVLSQLPESVRKISDKYCTEAADIDSFIESIRPELQQRLARKKEDPSAEFETITFVIDNYSQFFEKVSNDTISRLLAIIKIGKELSLRIVASSDAYQLTSLVNRGEATTLSMVHGDLSVMLGGCINDHNCISTKAPYAQKSELVGEHEGYLIRKSAPIRFKAMNHSGE